MRILSFKGYTGALGYIHRDSIETLRELGHNVSLFKLPSQVENPAEEYYVEELTQKIEEFRPDFILAMNHIGVNSRLLDSKKIPYVSWFVDNPFRWTWNEHFTPSSYCLLLTWDRVYIKGLRDLGFEQILYLPIASNPKKFRKIDLTDEDRAKYECNISFGGESMYRAYRKAYEGVNDPNTREVIDRVIELQGENPLLEVRDILERVEVEHGMNLAFNSQGEREAFKMRLEMAAMAVYRGELIKEIYDLGLILGGDPEWDTLMGKEIMGNERVKLFIQLDNRTELPKLYNASKINLNITKSQLRTALPMRVFDISCCGAFLLTDYRKDLGDLFKIGEEVFFYQNKKELRELCEYFLGHPDERREIGARAKLRVLKDHIYTHRMQELIKIVSGVF